METPGATGVGLDHPSYDGRTLPFHEGLQDAVFAATVSSTSKILAGNGHGVERSGLVIRE
jgi:hypothetical protein